MELDQATAKNQEHSLGLPSALEPSPGVPQGAGISRGAENSGPQIRMQMSQAVC